MLFTEHDMDAVFDHADAVIVLVRGEIIARGRPAEVRADPIVAPGLDALRRSRLEALRMQQAGNILELDGIDAA